jgi:hypothetical protein
MDQELIIEINTDGTSNLEVINGDGKNCKTFSKKFEENLGAVTKRTYKEEYERHKQKVTQYQKQRLKQ